jgi:CHAT domain
MNYNNSLSLWNFDEYFFRMSREDERSTRKPLVSHWEVDSEATVALMDGLFEALRANPRLSHAEALRMSMLRISQERPASAGRVIGKANWNSDPFLPSDDAVS